MRKNKEMQHVLTFKRLEPDNIAIQIANAFLLRKKREKMCVFFRLRSSSRSTISIYVK